MKKTKKTTHLKDSKTVPPAKVKKRLEAAVLKVFSENDFHQADMRTLAKSGGVSLETIYKYYGGDYSQYQRRHGYTRKNQDDLLDPTRLL